MILDSIANLKCYHNLHPAISIVCNYIANTDLKKLLFGRNDIMENRLYLSTEIFEGNGDAAKLEVHQKFIDIQYSLDGTDRIGWMPLFACTDPVGQFNCEKDILLFNDTPQSWIYLYPGSFTIFLPSDAHAPLGGTGPVHKVIFKLAVEW